MNARVRGGLAVLLAGVLAPSACGQLKAGKAAALVGEARDAFRIAADAGPKTPDSAASKADDRLVLLRRELLRLGPAAVAPLLEPDGEKRRFTPFSKWARETIRRMGTAVLPALEEACGSPRAAIRERGLACLGYTGDASAIGPILAALRDPDFDVRQAAASALSDLDRSLAVRRHSRLRDDARVLPALLDLLPEQPLLVSEPLATLGDRRATGPLLETLGRLRSTQDADVVAAQDREQASHRVVLALKRLADPSAAPALVREIQESFQREAALPPQSPEPWAAPRGQAEHFYRSSLRSALGDIGPPAAAEVAVLLDHPDPRVQRTAVMVFQRTGVPAQAAERVMALLDDPDPKISREAALALASHSQRDLAPLLRALARLPKAGDEHSWRLRSALVRALARCDDPGAAEALRAVASDPAERAAVRGIALENLLTLEAPLVGKALSWELLAAILHHPTLSPLVERNGLLSLEAITDDPVALLLQVLESGADPKLRIMVVWPLAQFDDPRAVAPLIRAAQSFRTAKAPLGQALARNAAEALGEMGERRAVPALMGILTSGAASEGLKARTATALGQIGDPRARDPIRRLLRKAKPGSDREASFAAALGMLGDPAVIPILKERLKSGFHGSAVRGAAYIFTRQAAQALVRIGKPAVPVLLDALDWRYRHTADYACLALAEVGDPRALQPITRLLEYPAESTRHDAALALGVLGDRAAIPRLEWATGDPSGYVRVAAAEALWRLGENQHLAVVTAALLDPQSEDGDRAEAAAALARLGDPAGRAALQQALAGPNAAVRQAAREALAALEPGARPRPRSPMPW